MRFKVYRDVNSRRLRKVVVELQDNDGNILDRTFMFGYAAMIGFRFRVRMRQWAMLRLQRAMKSLSR
jgi:hypothetical protein